MPLRIGIDLGTTMSVVAVKGRVQLTAGCNLQPVYLAECDVSIIPIDDDYLVPSALWWQKSEPDKYLVGQDAKLKAESGGTPIQFSKRAIGTTEKLVLDGRVFTAREVAEQVLRYLKQRTEEALGDKVGTAVVTHPAYFDRGQIEETRQAAQAAELRIDSPKQMLMEPAAAALSYICQDSRDPLRVLTYDLGGGTFDVTVLERRGGVTRLLSHDGDNLLGGYNFDRALAAWILDSIRAQGRKLNLEPADFEPGKPRPTDADLGGLWSQLLALAERLKLELSRKPSVPVQVTFLPDANGRPFVYSGMITQAQFAQLIGKELQKTVTCCHRALGKAGLRPDELHAVLFVGGSTYGPWTQEAVSQAFAAATVIHPYYPDYCVAAGAAIAANELPVVTAAPGCPVELALDSLPTTTADLQIDVSGSVQVLRTAGAPAGLELVLTPADAPPLTQRPAADGNFVFADVPLVPNAPNELRLEVQDAATATVLCSSVCTVTHNEAAAEDQTIIYTNLPKSVLLHTGSGLKAIGHEGATLPVKTRVELQLNFKDGYLRVPIYQGDQHQGDIVIDSIPGTGDALAVEVEISGDNSVRGITRVTSTGGVVVREEPVDVVFPPTPVPEVDELAKGLEALRQERDEALHNEQDGERRLQLKVVGNQHLREAERLLGDMRPDRQQIARILRELDRLVHPLGQDMQPPLHEFRSVQDDSWGLVDASPTGALQSYQDKLRKLDRRGNDAYLTRNNRVWQEVTEEAVELNKRLNAQLEAERAGGTQGPGGDRPRDDEPSGPVGWQVRDAMLAEVDRLKRDVDAARLLRRADPDYDVCWAARCDEADAQLRDAGQTLRAIDVDKDGDNKTIPKCRNVRRTLIDVEQRIGWIREGVHVR